MLGWVLYKHCLADNGVFTCMSGNGSQVSESEILTSGIKAEISCITSPSKTQSCSVS